jgi:hypothetical protein
MDQLARMGDVLVTAMQGMVEVPKPVTTIGWEKPPSGVA